MVTNLYGQMLSKRLVKSPTVYLNDAGSLSYLQGLTEEKISQDSDLIGSLLKKIFIMEFYKQSNWSQTQPQFFYLRAHAGQEIDFILEILGIYMGHKIVPFDSNLFAVPISALWEE